jgi:hypothetical protein
MNEIPEDNYKILILSLDCQYFCELFASWFVALGLDDAHPVVLCFFEEIHSGQRSLRVLDSVAEGENTRSVESFHWSLEMMGFLALLDLPIFLFLIDSL